ncbi:MAG: hypothetical protein JRE40_03305 [Deltaproteobacteria bacterium]|nr:hypothetical protein [Deltaproteobacteria bacterium]MBW2675546.1 hypothetical protein [Deltaproteobacteria bacterium]
MAEVKWWKTLSISAAANGGEGEDEYVPTEDVKINVVMATERSSQNLANVFAEITHEGYDLTLGPIPCAVIGSDQETALRVEKILHRGNSFHVKIVNNLTVDVTVDITLECLAP